MGDLGLIPGLGRSKESVGYNWATNTSNFHFQLTNCLDAKRTIGLNSLRAQEQQSPRPQPGAEPGRARRCPRAVHRSPPTAWPQFPALPNNRHFLCPENLNIYWMLFYLWITFYYIFLGLHCRLQKTPLLQKQVFRIQSWVFSFHLLYPEYMEKTRGSLPHFCPIQQAFHPAIPLVYRDPSPFPIPTTPGRPSGFTGQGLTWVEPTQGQAQPCLALGTRI